MTCERCGSSSVLADHDGPTCLACSHVAGSRRPWEEPYHGRGARAATTMDTAHRLAMQRDADRTRREREAAV